MTSMTMNHILWKMTIDTNSWYYSIDSGVDDIIAFIMRKGHNREGGTPPSSATWF